MLRLDAVILDEMGYLPFSQAGGALLFHLPSKLYEHTSAVITTIEEFVTALGDYIRWYNNVRIKMSLGFRSPAEHRGILRIAA